jgi:hypothetical protein
MESLRRLRQAHPESFRAKDVTCRNGQKRAIWAFTKTVRLKKYGSKATRYRS